tara:strand:- start:3631 stop:4908 length:1278 start_codon:yes stop_codon:yes gene_type:complete
MLKEKYFISIFLLVLTISCKEKYSKSITITDKAALDKLIDDQISEGLHPFLYLRLEDIQGKVLYEHSAVNNDLLPGVRINKDTWIRIWSMSKIVTITIIMDLIEDNILNLDEPVTKYIPEFENLMVATDLNGVSLALSDSISKTCSYELEPVKHKMTLRHLINHTAGFYYATTKNKCINSALADQSIPIAADGSDLINKFSKVPLIQQPGESHFYGLNTTVLGLVAERATHTDLATLVKLRMTKKLGINGLKYNLAIDQELLPCATGIDTVLRLVRENELDIFGPAFPTYSSDNRAFLGGEGMIATADGYSDFLRIFLNKGMLNGKSFLKVKSINEITSPQTRLDSKWGYNGYNLWVTGDTLRASGWGDEGLWQGGGYEGTQFWIDPKRRFVGVLMTQSNSLQKGAYEFYNDFRGELYKQIFENE